MFLTILPIMVSALALIVSGWFSMLAASDRKRAGLDRKETIRLGRERDVMAWINEVRGRYVSLLIGAGSDDRAVRENLAHLSALIDQGRLHFPNDSNGLRSRVLDPLVELVRRFSKGNFDEKKAMQDWREFTDQIAKHTSAFAIDTSPEAQGQPQYRNR